MKSIFLSIGALFFAAGCATTVTQPAYTGMAEADVMAACPPASRVVYAVGAAMISECTDKPDEVVAILDGEAAAVLTRSEYTDMLARTQCHAQENPGVCEANVRAQQAQWVNAMDRNNARIQQATAARRSAALAHGLASVSQSYQNAASAPAQRTTTNCQLRSTWVGGQPSSMDCITQ